jgi:hypothetical protein
MIYLYRTMAFIPSVTVGATAQTLLDIGFSAQDIGTANGVRVGVEGDEVRFSDTNGFDPTDTDGTKLEPNQVYILTPSNLEDFQLIRVSTDAICQMALVRV